MYDEDMPIGDPFVLEWDDGSYTTSSAKDLSRHWDLADCGEMDNIANVYARGSDGKLQPVRLGEQTRINEDQEYPLYFASAPVTTEDGRVAGYVTFTDH